MSFLKVLPHFISLPRTLLFPLVAYEITSSLRRSMIIVLWHFWALIFLAWFKHMHFHNGCLSYLQFDNQMGHRLMESNIDCILWWLKPLMACEPWFSTKFALILFFQTTKKVWFDKAYLIYLIQSFNLTFQLI